MTDLCPCGSKIDYTFCCAPYHQGEKLAPTAETLMRSRYSAFAKAEIAYLKETTWPSLQKNFEETSYYMRSTSSAWLSLEIIDIQAGKEEDIKGNVTFIATSLFNGKLERQKENSLFKKESGRWYYVKAM